MRELQEVPHCRKNIRRQSAVRAKLDLSLIASRGFNIGKIRNRFRDAFGQSKADSCILTKKTRSDPVPQHDPPRGMLQHLVAAGINGRRHRIGFPCTIRQKEIAFRRNPGSVAAGIVPPRF